MGADAFLAMLHTLFGHSKSITPTEPWTAKTANHLSRAITPPAPQNTSSTASPRSTNRNHQRRLERWKLLTEYQDIWICKINSQDELIYS